MVLSIILVNCDVCWGYIVVSKVEEGKYKVMWSEFLSINERVLYDIMRDVFCKVYPNKLVHIKFEKN